MKRLKVAAAVATAFALTFAASAQGEAPTTSTVDLQALMDRMNKLEAANQEQAKKIQQLEAQLAKPVNEPIILAANEKVDEKARPVEEGTKVSESGRLYTAENGKSYYLVDRMAGIFEPLSESGLSITPYGYLVLETTHNTHGSEIDVYSDFVRPKGVRGGGSTTTLSVQDSILGIRMETPEDYKGWKFAGKAEFDLAGAHSNDYAFHWRHLYMEATHEESGWSILGGQTWHLWKMVAPNSIDGAWLEYTGYPYRRSPQFRVTKKFAWEKSGLELRAGIVKGGPGMGGDRDGDGNQDNAASSWALFEGAALFTHEAAWQAEDANSREWMIGVGAMYGRDKSHDASAWDAAGNPTDFGGKNSEYDSKMIMLAGSVPFSIPKIGEFSLCGQVFAGDNLGGIQGGVGQRVGFMPYSQRGREVSTVGGFGDLRYYLNDKWSFALGYGFDDPTDSEAKYADGIGYNDRMYMDVFYTINANLSLGFEYGHLRTRYVSDAMYEGCKLGTSSDDRFQFTVFYNF